MTDVAEVLADHQWHHTRDTHCTCGFRTPLAQLAVEGFIAHVAEQIQPLINAEKRHAWDEGATLASPHGGGYLRSLLIENPYHPAPTSS